MDREDIDRIEDILRKIKTLRRSIRKDLDQFHDLLSELHDLVSDLSYLKRIVSSEVKYFNGLSARFRDFSVYSSVQRRLPDLRRLVRDEEDQEDSVRRNTDKVKNKLQKLDRYLSNIG